MQHQQQQRGRQSLHAQHHRSARPPQARLRAMAAAHYRQRRTIQTTAAAIPPMCFDAACQRAVDAAFVAAIGGPLVAATALGVWFFFVRAPPKDALESGKVFEDADTGTLFEAPDGMAPELDKNSLLAFRAVSYTPWPVPADALGERLFVDVGRVGSTAPRTFVFDRTLTGGGGGGGNGGSGGSEIVAVRLPRPLGLEFEFDVKRRAVVVAGVVPGGNAEQQLKVARLGSAGSGAAAAAAREGDVLRALTCTTPVWPTKALFGAVAPERHIVLYGLPPGKATWSGVRAALRRGKASDGPVTLVLERARPNDQTADGGDSSAGTV